MRAHTPASSMTVGLTLSLLLGAACLAAQPNVAAIDEAIASGDDARINKAAADIRAGLVGGTRFGVINNLNGKWVRALIAAKKPDLAADLALAGVLAWPRQLNEVEGLMTLRIQALNEAGRHQEALAAAKGLFNVASMSGTAAAINQLQECLRLVHGENAPLVAQFRKEQQEGAALRDSPPARAGTVMAGIAIDPRPFDEALARYGQDKDGLICRGNLLLLSDRPREAREVFAKIYESSPEGELASATESLARCIKAEDGAIGRANKFVLDLRPVREAP
jgi:hypothetical protein